MGKVIQFPSKKVFHPIENPFKNIIGNIQTNKQKSMLKWYEKLFGWLQ